LVLTEEERSVLAGWARRRKTAQALALRSRIVLACAEPEATIASVSTRLEVSRGTVSKWRSSFQADRLEGLSDEPRPGRPRVISDKAVEAVIVKTLEESPGEDTHWSTRSMAAATGMSQSAVSRIWRAFGLKPHAINTWKLSTDPQFVDKVRDVVGIYLDPPENALVARGGREEPDPGGRPHGPDPAGAARHAGADESRGSSTSSMWA
jgi:transposase-like protein